MSERKEVCGNCAAYHAGRGRRSQCRLNPPLPIVTGFGFAFGAEAFWPEVNSDSWCLQWRPKQEADDAQS